MKAISIRELHLETGRCVRAIGKGDRVVVTDRGRAIAVLLPFDAALIQKPLPDREAQIRRLPRIPVESAMYVSEGRDRA